ncbi:hypothetical protein BYT27DRAFT_7257868 [Phlegmacium glaucopus]|nr:hypothetical protein BYT27DRAFT_7257868 [Phlegmacium glaucopus]
MNGLKPIVDEWPSLLDAGFSIIDAVVPSPNGHGETYFFSGTQYALVKVVPGTTDDRIINGPKSISTEWPSKILKHYKHEEFEAHQIFGKAGGRQPKGLPETIDPDEETVPGIEHLGWRHSWLRLCYGQQPL